MSCGTHRATYDYLDHSPLVGQITFDTNGTTVMTTTNGYDHLNRLTNTASLGGTGSTRSQFDYQYNPASQRPRVTHLDGSYWVYGYDSMGQVTSGRKYWSDGTPVAGQQFDYAFDDIGNRQTTTRDGRQATYTPNTLNQYTNRTVPGFVNVLGTATNTATVSLWSQDNLALYTPTTRQGDYFRGEMLFNNNTGALWLTITNVAVLSNHSGADIVTNTIGKLFVPKTAEVFGYDADGNLTNDGRWVYTWDAENRLVKQESLSGAPAAAKLKLEFQYDSQGRRMQKLVSTNNGSVYVAQYTNRFVYDGWNLLASLNPASAVRQSYLWGLDLSGTMQGAGGVGGLLAITDASQGSHFCAYDGNGNVTALVKADGSGLTAQYEYGPFGELLRATGPMARANPFRFSTKYQDDESDLIYYGYRYYNPSTGRWPNRDPIEEFGGRALYAFVGNNPISFLDALGLADTLEPGGNANGSIPANGPGRNFTPDERGAINQLGQNEGCHTCGSKTAGTKTGNFVPDHQPPSALAKPGQQQRLYPHCLPCSQKQGGEVSAALRAQRLNAARARGAGAAILILGALSTALDKAIAAQDQKRYDDAYAVCQKKAAEAGLDEGCGCCIIGVILKWSQPARGPTWLDRLGGRTMGYGPSGTATLGSVSGTFYNKPCDEVHDPGVWLDWSSTYESHKISF